MLKKVIWLAILANSMVVASDVVFQKVISQGATVRIVKTVTEKEETPPLNREPGRFYLSGKSIVDTYTLYLNADARFDGRAIWTTSFSDIPEYEALGSRVMKVFDVAIRGDDVYVFYMQGANFKVDIVNKSAVKPLTMSVAVSGMDPHSDKLQNAYVLPAENNKIICWFEMEDERYEMIIVTNYNDKPFCEHWVMDNQRRWNCRWTSATHAAPTKNRQ